MSLNRDDLAPLITALRNLNISLTSTGNTVDIDQTTPGTTNGVVPAGLVADNSAITTNKPVLVGGQAVDNTSYAPAYTAADAVTGNFDKDTGALIVAGITPSAYRLQGMVATAVAVKASAGSLMGWNIRNNTAASAYVKFCNMAQGSTTPGTTAVVFSLQVPANGSVFQENNGSSQHYFSTAITAYACTGFLDNDATSPGANNITVELKYK